MIYWSGFVHKRGHHVDIVLDDQLVETRDITFTAVKGENDHQILQPCLSVEQLTRWGVRTALFPQLAVDNSECANLQAIPQASTDFQFGAQRLVISLPQAAIDLPARGYVSPEMWDEGINAAMRRGRGNDILNISCRVSVIPYPAVPSDIHRTDQPRLHVKY